MKQGGCTNCGTVYGVADTDTFCKCCLKPHCPVCGTHYPTGFVCTFDEVKVPYPIRMTVQALNGGDTPAETYCLRCGLPYSIIRGKRPRQWCRCGTGRVPPVVTSVPPGCVLTHNEKTA